MYKVGIQLNVCTKLPGSEVSAVCDSASCCSLIQPVVLVKMRTHGGPYAPIFPLFGRICDLCIFRYLGEWKAVVFEEARTFRYLLVYNWEGGRWYYLAIYIRTICGVYHFIRSTAHGRRVLSSHKHPPVPRPTNSTITIYLLSGPMSQTFNVLFSY